VFRRLAQRLVCWLLFDSRLCAGFSETEVSFKDLAGTVPTYADVSIAKQVRFATRQVLAGKQAYERDGVLFDKIQYSWPLLSVLLWVALKNDGRLEVVDFGGSMGTTYFQNRKYLDPISD
jgi:hypothetical protein